MALFGFCCGILVGISRRVGVELEFMCSVLLLLAFTAIGSNRVDRVVETVVIVVWHCSVVLFAVKVVMVLMTFDKVLRGLPVAAVLVKVIF